MTVVCYVEKDSDGGVSDPSARAVTFASSLATQNGEQVLATVLASRAGTSIGGSPTSAAGAGGSGSGGGGGGDQNELALAVEAGIVEEG